MLHLAHSSLTFPSKKPMSVKHNLKHYHGPNQMYILSLRTYTSRLNSFPLTIVSITNSNVLNYWLTGNHMVKYGTKQWCWTKQWKNRWQRETGCQEKTTIPVTNPAMFSSLAVELLFIFCISLRITTLLSTSTHW